MKSCLNHGVVNRAKSKYRNKTKFKGTFITPSRGLKKVELHLTLYDLMLAVRLPCYFTGQFMKTNAYQYTHTHTHPHHKSQDRIVATANLGWYRK